MFVLKLEKAYEKDEDRHQGKNMISHGIHHNIRIYHPPYLGVYQYEN